MKASNRRVPKAQRGAQSLHDAFSADRSQNGKRQAKQVGKKSSKADRKLVVPKVPDASDVMEVRIGAYMQLDSSFPDALIYGISPWLISWELPPPPPSYKAWEVVDDCFCHACNQTLPNAEAATVHRMLCLEDQ